MEKTRIIIVEDERIVADDIKTTLNSFGYAVIAIINNGQQAVEKALELKPDLMLMDIMLKGKMNGIEAASRIKEKIEIPIIYLTAYADNATLEKAKVTEPFGYIVKPFSEKELHSTIEMAIYKHKSEKKIKESEQKYKELYDNAPDGFLSTDDQWRIFESNKKIQDMLGRSPQELKGAFITDFIKADLVETFEKALQKFRKSGYLMNFETELIKKDKSSFHAVINSSISCDEENGFVKIQTSIKDVSRLKDLEDENTMLSEKIIKLSKKIQLTENEKKVLYGMVANSLLNDVELSKLIKIKRSTVTSIKNKLLRENYYSTIRMPDFVFLGCELFSVIHAKINTANPNNEQKTKLLKQLSQSEDIFYFNANDRELMGFIISKNLTSLKKDVLSIFDAYEKYGFLDDLVVSHFPFEISSVTNFFDYSSLLCKLFGFEPLKQPKPSKKHASKKLTQNEKMILYALVRYPQLNDSELAEKTGFPRPSISQTRRRLIEDGTITCINIPNILQIKQELLIFDHIRLENKLDKNSSKLLNDYFKSCSGMIFVMTEDSEIYAASVYDDYSDFDIAHSDMLAYLNKNRILIKRKDNHIFPITQMKSSKLDFAHLLKKILDIKKQF